MGPTPQVFLSHAAEDSFEAGLLQRVLEIEMPVKVWAYGRDQERGNGTVAANMRKAIDDARAAIFLVSPSTLDSGLTQCYELGCFDTTGIPCFVLLHHMTYHEMLASGRTPPPLIGRDCIPAGSRSRSK